MTSSAKEKKAQVEATADVDKVQAPVWERNRGTMTVEQANFVAEKREEAIRRKAIRTMQAAAAGVWGWCRDWEG